MVVKRLNSYKTSLYTKWLSSVKLDYKRLKLQPALHKMACVKVVKLPNTNPYSYRMRANPEVPCSYGGPQLSRENKKSRHYKLYSRQDNVI